MAETCLFLNTEQTFAELKDFEIGGFEIYNCRYRNFRENDYSALMNFSKESNLLVLDAMVLIFRLLFSATIREI
jgi:predicted ester cyclase